MTPSDRSQPMAMLTKRSTRVALLTAFVFGVSGLTAAVWRSADPGLSRSRGSVSIDESEPDTARGIVPRSDAESIPEAGVDSSDSRTDVLSEADAVDFELEEALRWAREEAAADVQVGYSLMFEHLGLSSSQREMLAQFLVEVAMSRTFMRNYRPEPIEEADRQAGIAAIIGDAGLQRLLELEKKRSEYYEASRIANVLRQNGESMTDLQLDQTLSILVHVRGREQAVANRDAEPGTIEAIESQMATMDEYERLVLELAPSVLSTKQVQLLYENYRSLSYRRAEILEMQKRSRANDNDEDDVPLGYPPRT